MVYRKTEHPEEISGRSYDEVGAKLVFKSDAEIALPRERSGRLHLQVGNFWPWVFHRFA